MSCQCYQIGGPFIAEDPDCPAHGLEAQREAQQEAARRDEVIRSLESALEDGSERYLERAARWALEYLKSL